MIYTETTRCHLCGQTYTKREFYPACSQDHLDTLRSEVAGEPYSPPIGDQRCSPTELPQALRELRKKSNLSQEKLGALIGVTAGAVSQYETGSRQLSLMTVEHWAKACQGTAAVTLGGSEDMKKQDKIKLWVKFINHSYAAWSALFELITGFKPPKMREIADLISGKDQK